MIPRRESLKWRRAVDIEQKSMAAQNAAKIKANSNEDGN